MTSVLEIQNSNPLSSSLMLHSVNSCTVKREHNLSQSIIGVASAHYETQLQLATIQLWSKRGDRKWNEFANSVQTFSSSSFVLARVFIKSTDDKCWNISTTLMCSPPRCFPRNKLLFVSSNNLNTFSRRQSCFVSSMLKLRLGAFEL